MATKENYLRALEEAIREYEQLLKERARIDERLSQLVQTMSSLSRLCKLAPTIELGLTDACRMVLKTAAHPLTAAEIRGQLEAMGFDCSRYSNPLASIHTVLRRLCRSGEANVTNRLHDRPAFSCKPPGIILALPKSKVPDLNLWLASIWASKTGDSPKRK
jgi:hypothetical protein